MSEVNVNEDPSAGFMAVAENRERGLVGTLVAWAFITYSQLFLSSSCLFFSSGLFFLNLASSCDPGKEDSRR